MSRDTIVLISTYTHPSRDSIEATLRAAFPEYRFENVGLREILKRRPDWAIQNLWFLVKEYGKDILLRRETARVRFLQTTYLFRKIHEAARSFVDPRRHVFSFQTQSMYDMSVAGVPHFIYTDHAHLSNLENPSFDQRRLRPQAWIDLESTIYHNATCVFTRSTNVTDDIVKYYGVDASKVVCVYAGSNVRMPPGYRAANTGYSNQNILFVGKDWERKGGPELVEAFLEVLKVHPDAHLTIAGARPVLNVPNCSILGSVPLGQLAYHYASASVFCLPSRVEPFGVAFLEAMMHRLPIVATHVEAVPDMVKEGITGHLVAPGDVNGLARALSGLLSDPDRCQRYGESGYRHVVETYTWDRVGQRLRSHILPIVERVSAIAPES